MTELEKQVWKKMEEMGWSNAPAKGLNLEYFENIIECTRQVLGVADAERESEELVCACKNAELYKDSLVPVYCHNCNSYVKTDAQHTNKPHETPRTKP
jgi:hypothetical protein